jgi:branched-chain amino acid transport system permease protein
MTSQRLFTPTPSGIAGLIFAAFAFFVVPLVAGGQWLNVFISMACFALAVAGCAFMYARMGMVSLTQVGLMGVGGWVTLRLNYLFDFPFELNLLVAMFITALFGLVLALPALRMRGLYLALVTLMAAAGFEILFATFQFPNGGDAFWGVQTGTSGDFRRPSLATSDAAYLRYLVAVVTAAFLLIELHRRTAPGRAWALIRRSEAAAMAAGVNVTFYKAWAFALAGLLAGLGGGLLAGSLGLLDGGTFRASESVMIFALAIVGGAHSWLGVLIAAALFRVLPAALNNAGLDADLSFVIFGAGLLHAVISAPEGLAGQFVRFINTKLQKQTQSVQEHAPTLVSMESRTGSSSLSNQDNSTPDFAHHVEIDSITVKFGGVVALNNVAVTFKSPVSGIIGPNGAGKTTLMNVMSGFIEPTSGSVRSDKNLITAMAPFQRSRWGLRRSFQKEEVADDLTVSENIVAQIDTDRTPAAEKHEQVSRALEFVGLSHRSDVLGRNLNTFERRLTDIAKCVVGQPRLIMFDEPAGGMSVDETNRLGDLILQIHEFCGAQVLVIDHDVELITRICEETLVLDFGEKIAFGSTSDVLSDDRVRSAYLGLDNETAEEGQGNA